MSTESSLVAKQRRLAVLEVTAARYGIDCPPQVINEIEDLRREIAELQKLAPATASAQRHTERMVSTYEPTTILAVFSQPLQLPPTAWEREARELRAILIPFAPRYRLQELSNCTPAELHRALLHLSPSVLHFQGHGSINGLVFADTHGDGYPVTWQALMRTLAVCDSISCVMLNACDSHVHALVEPQRFHLVTTTGAISAEATRTFTSGFYTALVAGRSIPQAHRDGCNLLDLEGYAQAEWPVLTRANV